MKNNRQMTENYIKRAICLILLLSFTVLPLPVLAAVPADAKRAGKAFAKASEAGEGTEEEAAFSTEEYEQYRRRLDGPKTKEEIAEYGFEVIESQIFPVTMRAFGEAFFIPALDAQYHRLALFFADDNGEIVYRTDQLEMNFTNRGRLEQPNEAIASVAFQDLNGNGLTDIVLITSCVNASGTFTGRPYKVGEVLFQNESGFYRDFRISDKINRFSMNKSAEFITSFVRDGKSTEFLYTAETLNELLQNGFRIIEEQCYWRDFKKLGRLKLVPGTISIADYEIFMIYLVNGQGDIVWSFQPMGDYDNLYALKGINCRDIDGDDLKDIIVLARYSYEGDENALVVESDYAIFYQRTGGFYADTEFKKTYKCSDEDTMTGLVEKARAYWGWRVEA